MLKHTDLWHRYKTLGDQAARDELLRLHLPMVRYLADWLNSSMHLSHGRKELEGFGLHGLLEAVDHFDPARGIGFEHYAAQRVRGAMLDGVRADSWAPSVRRKQHTIEAACARLQSRLGRMPEDAELARELGVTPARLARWQSAAAALTVISLDDPWLGDEEGLTVAEQLPHPGADDPAAATVAAEERVALAAAIETLPERERLIISLVYFEGMALKEIAVILGVSLSRASQLHSRALLRLRTQLLSVPAGSTV